MTDLYFVGKNFTSRDLEHRPELNTTVTTAIHQLIKIKRPVIMIIH